MNKILLLQIDLSLAAAQQFNGRKDETGIFLKTSLV